MRLFQSKFTLPASKKTLHASQINNAEFIELQKCLFEDDDVQILEFFEHLINEHCSGNANDLYNIDKFACLLKLRSISCGDVINFSMGSNEVQLSISMSKIINDLNDYKMHQPLQHKISPAMHAIIDYPSSLLMSQHKDGFCSMVKSIKTTDGITICINDLNEMQKQMLFNSISSNIMTSINEFIVNSAQNICIIPGNEQLKVHEIGVSPFNNSMFEFAKFAFRDDLMNAYKMMYVLSSKANMNLAYLNSIAPVEQQMYAKFLIEDVEEQNRQLKQSSPNLNTHK